MSNDVGATSSTKPAQFRLPAWAREFLTQESEASGSTRTDVVLEALAVYRDKRLRERLAEGYRHCAEVSLAEVQEWDSTLNDGLDAGW